MLLPAWDRLGQKWADRLKVVVVTTDAPETTRAIQQHYRLALTLLSDTEQRCAKAYNVVWLPRAFLLDEQGRVRYVQPETVFDWREVIRAVEQEVARIPLKE